jgi:putative ABC transport system permease protein
MLALGIGSTTAIFSLIEGVLLRHFPFKNPDRLVILGDHLRNGSGVSVTAREIGIYSESTGAFTSMGGFIGKDFEVSGNGVPQEVSGEKFTANVFPTLGVEPLLGRVFTREEDDSHLPVAVISYAFWTNHYHRDHNIIGNSINLDRKAYTIIGIMPRSFEFPLASSPLDRVQVWVPMSLTAEDKNEQSGFWGYRMIARLKDGVTSAQGAQDADRVARQIMRGFPASMAAIHIRGDVTPLHEYEVGEVRPVLRTLFLAVSVVLLIACANVAGLLLVQAIRRRREYAIRLALGARSGVIIRESIIEGIMLSIAACLLGLGLAITAIRTALHLLPDSMPRVDSISIDVGVISFALLLALLTGTLSSLAPAFAALRTNLTATLKEGERSAAGASHSWLRSGLVVIEIAVALVLLTTSGAFLRSLQKMHAVDPGFRPEHVIVADYSLPNTQYSTQQSLDAFNRAVVEKLSTKPGMAAVGLTSMLPASDQIAQSAYTIEDEPADQWKLKFAGFAIIYGDYFRAMQIPLLEGRYFDEHDRADSPLVIVVNQTMAKDCWPGKDPIGKRMHVGNPKKGLPWATVVGVVADTAVGSRDGEIIDQWYAPALQPAILLGNDIGARRPPVTTNGFITLRSSLPPEQLPQTLRAAVAEADPLLALQHIRRMQDVISNVEAPRRFNTDLITSFALGALLLAASGIYAVVAFSVSLRAQEIALRMALGAQRTNIARLVLISAAKLALLGCAIGVAASAAVSHLMSSFLFKVSPTDPLIYSAAVALMIVLSILASAIPAARAASADPIAALRAI